MVLEFVDRRGSCSAKWDALESMFGENDLLSMWIADMDFKEADCITEALRDYVDNKVMGYYRVPDSYKEAFIEWEKKYHGYEVKKEWLCNSPGIVPAINWILISATERQDAIIVLTPVYYPFLNAVKTNERKLVQCNLRREGMNYSIDFEKFEKDIIDNDVKIFIHSSPHNPVGRVWTKEENIGLMEICRKHGVLVLSDEIHQDFAYGNHKHFPVATLGNYDDILITMTSTSKTFNLAGLQNSFIIIPDEKLRNMYLNFQEEICMKDLNAFGCIATEAAYKGGRPWLEEAKKQIYSNYELIKNNFAKRLPDVGVGDLQGTYLLWLNFEKYFTDSKSAREFMQKRARIAIDYGDWFGGEEFASFIRMNLATPTNYVQKAVDSLVKTAEGWKR